MAESLKYSVEQYGSHELQRVGVWDLDLADHTKTKYWIVYIHGGAWRDPRITHETFAPLITRLVNINSDDDDDASSSSPIAAFASVDYRLSPHPDFPQDPAATPPEQLRNARHPDHLNDVRAALAFLQRRYGFADRYVLLGHSAGGTLAYQLLGTAPPLESRSNSNSREKSCEEVEVEVELPRAVFGFEGIYDFTGLNARFGGSYAGFLTAAFGGPEKWDAAAPMKYAGRYGDRFAGLAVLGQSPDDELVDEPEADGMAERLRGDLDAEKVLLVKDLEGTHNETWENGTAVARTVLRILRILQGGGKGGIGE
ncbi:alpha/beta-hydrolase [Hypoxylon sp. NC0597]|nr:alpha/beta-hydrolase [Hypoxylon sp. NC0597]